MQLNLTLGNAIFERKALLFPPRKQKDLGLSQI
jgi:hypothetical protein